jgi:hypothetical protein
MATGLLAWNFYHVGLENQRQAAIHANPCFFGIKRTRPEVIILLNKSLVCTRRFTKREAKITYVRHAAAPLSQAGHY